MTKTIYQREKFIDVIDEAMPLVNKHYQEIAHFKDILLDPDFDFYNHMEESGVFYVFTARQSESLVGYAAYFVKPNPHYKTSLQAVQDVLYIHPKKRGFGKEFINWIDSQLSKMGVQATYHHTKAAYDFGPMLKRQGYELVDLIYAKRLD